MLVLENRVKEPPYIGFPSLSHHFPVADPVVEVVVVFVVDVEEVVTFVVVEVVVVLVVVVVVVVALLQDARSIDATMRKVSVIQITPFFKISSFFIILPSGHSLRIQN
jgi:hypothetical protein